MSLCSTDPSLIGTQSLLGNMLAFLNLIKFFKLLEILCEALNPAVSNTPSLLLVSLLQIFTKLKGPDAIWPEKNDFSVRI